MSSSEDGMLRFLNGRNAKKGHFSEGKDPVKRRMGDGKAKVSEWIERIIFLS